MKKTSLTLSLLLLFAGGCEEYKAKKIQEIESQYSKAKSIPSSDPCGNIKEYQALLDLEIKSGTDIYKEKSKQKIELYQEPCNQKIEANLTRLKCEGKYNEEDYILVKFQKPIDGNKLWFINDYYWVKTNYTWLPDQIKFKHMFLGDKGWYVIDRKTLEFGKSNFLTHTCKLISEGQLVNAVLIHRYKYGQNKF